MRSINWGKGKREFDRYQTFEAFLWGALAQLYPSRRVQRPRQAALAEEFDAGMEIARGGFVNLSPDANPTEIVRRRKQEHQLKRAEERARQAA